MDRLGPDILSVLRMKGQVLQRARANWKVPGWWFVFKYASEEEVTYVFVAFFMSWAEVVRR